MQEPSAPDCVQQHAGEAAVVAGRGGAAPHAANQRKQSATIPRQHREADSTQRGGGEQQRHVQTSRPVRLPHQSDDADAGRSVGLFSAHWRRLIVIQPLV